MTIHRFLKWDKDSNTFGVNLFEKDYSKLIIIDEVSMIDLSLLANLFKGLTNDIKIILVGDYNQLPSVGPGQILKDLIECEVIDTVMLSLLYRQDDDSYISSLALEIKDNNLSEDFLQPRSDYKFLTCSSDSICSNLKKICKQIYDKGFDYKTVQVMAPMYAGVNGIDNLNKELQNIFNPQDNKKKEIIFGDVIFRENDKILQLVNKPEENIFNGDIGVIKNIILPFLSKSGKNEMEIDFDGHVVRYLTKDFISIKHGFVITIHKSQGSEFNTVIIPVCSSYQRMLYRKLIYTGITRAKRRLILLGEPSAFVRCVSNDNEYVRKTMLVERLKNF
ncbi:MAG: AAA family ATPase [Bacilli bacterium]